MLDRIYTRFISRLLFPIQERLKDHDTVLRLHELERSQWLSPEEIRSLQLERLQAFLSKAGQYVPYYRKLFAQRCFEPEKLSCVEALQQLPLLDKNTIREHHDQFMSSEAGKLVEYKTSGSTGAPLSFPVGMARISHDVAAKWRATRWWDVDLGDKEAVIWASPNELGAQDRIKALRDALFRSRLFPIHSFNDTTLDQYLAGIRAYKPKMIFGYPSALSRMAYRAQDTGFDMSGLGIKVIFVTSEILRPEWRAVIEKVFDAPVANEYGARDAGFLARECPHGGLHINAEDILLEIVDPETGQQKKPGDIGEVVVTHLLMSEFPLLRYRTGDMARFDDKNCPCGRGLPLLASPQGRTNDCLIAEDGNFVHDSALNYVLREMDNVRNYQIVQKDAKQVDISITASPELSSEQLSAVRHAYENLLGKNIELNLYPVKEIPAAKTGKFRHVICLIKQ